MHQYRSVPVPHRLSVSMLSVYGSTICRLLRYETETPAASGLSLPGSPGRDTGSRLSGARATDVFSSVRRIPSRCTFPLSGRYPKDDESRREVKGVCRETWLRRHADFPGRRRKGFIYHRSQQTGLRFRGSVSDNGPAGGNTGKPQSRRHTMQAASLNFRKNNMLRGVTRKALSITCIPPAQSTRVTAERAATLQLHNTGTGKSSRDSNAKQRMAAASGVTIRLLIIK